MMGVPSYEAMLDLFAQESAIKRLNTVEQVAAVAVLLASDVGAQHDRVHVPGRRRHDALLTSPAGSLRQPDDRL